jgi:TRAP-type C4-dicarboxylate transport system permease large subunit
MGNVTPPTAPFIFLAAKILNVNVGDMLKPVMQILIFCYVPALIIITFIPELSLWLPRLVLGTI